MQRIKILLKKDLTDIIRSKGILAPLFIAQLCTSILFPAIIMICGFISGSNFLEEISFFKETLIPMYNIPEEFGTFTGKLLYIFTNYSILPLLLILPFNGSAIICTHSIIGEKERKTLETLFNTPLKNNEIITAKICAPIIVSLIITLAELMLYMLVCNTISTIFIHIFIIYQFLWLFSIFIAALCVAVLGLSIIMIISIKAKTSVEAQQLSGLFITPLIMLMIFQITGLVHLNFYIILGFSFLFFITGIIIIYKVLPNFNREKILRKI
jgi:ABC-2 type transport system permease protein